MFINNPNVIIEDIDDFADYINNNDGWFNLIFEIKYLDSFILKIKNSLKT